MATWPPSPTSSGQVYQSSIVLGDPTRKVYVNSFNVFAQDQWQITPQLSLNYGLRYDYSSPLQSEKHDLSTFIPGAGGLVVAGQGIPTLYPGDKSNFGPRVGIAWQAAPRRRPGGARRRRRVLRHGGHQQVPGAVVTSSTAGHRGCRDNPAGSNPVGTYAKNGLRVADGRQPDLPQPDHAFRFGRIQLAEREPAFRHAGDVQLPCRDPATAGRRCRAAGRLCRQSGASPVAAQGHQPGCARRRRLGADLARCIRSSRITA